MIRITLQDDGEAERDLQESADRAERLGDKERDVKDAMVRANADVNFNPNHPKSILEVNADGSAAIGAKHPRGSYADELDIPDEEIADIYHRYIVDGT